MRAGTFDQPVLFSDIETQPTNTFGEPLRTPDGKNRLIPLATIFCLVEVLEGREFENAMQLNALAKYKITLRQPSFRLSPNMVATWNGRDLDILDVQDAPGRGRIQPTVVLIARDLLG